MLTLFFYFWHEDFFTLIVPLDLDEITSPRGSRLSVCDFVPSRHFSYLTGTTVSRGAHQGRHSSPFVSSDTQGAYNGGAARPSRRGDKLVSEQR